MKPYTWSYLKENLEFHQVVNRSRQHSNWLKVQENQDGSLFGLSIMQNWMTRHKICSFLIHTPLVGIKQSHLLNLNSQIACFIHKKEWIQLLKKPKNIAHWCHTLKEFNDYLSASAIDLKKFQDLYGIPYFDLTNQEEELKSESTKIEFKYTLSDNPSNPFSFYSLILHEE